jgi:hypothetical protein
LSLKRLDKRGGCVARGVAPTTPRIHGHIKETRTLDREYNYEKREAPELEASPQTRTKTTSKRKRIADDPRDLPAINFERLPRDVAESLRRDEISFRQHGLLTYIIGSIDWTRGDLARKLEVLHVEIDFRDSVETLRTDLDHLRKLEWLEYESKQGQRSPYCFRLGPRVFESLGLPEDFQRNILLISGSHLQNDEERGRSKPDEQSSKPPFQLPSSVLPIDKDVRQRQDVDGDQPRSNDGAREDEEWLRGELARVEGSQ